MNIFLSAFVSENLVSRDGFGNPVPRQLAHVHTQAESGAYLRDSSRVPRRRSYFYFKSPYAIGSVPSLSGHAIAYRWRSLPRVRGPRASKPQGSSERVLPRQVTMDQLIYTSLSHTHYWYEVGMSKVPAIYTWLIYSRGKYARRRPIRIYFACRTPWSQYPTTKSLATIMPNRVVCRNRKLGKTMSPRDCPIA